MSARQAELNATFSVNAPRKQVHNTPGSTCSAAQGIQREQWLREADAESGSEER